jgi:hypothetical protein
MDCQNAGPIPFLISQNIFMSYEGGQGAGGSAINSTCNSSEHSAFWGVIEDNIFEDGQSSPFGSQANVLELTGKMNIIHNIFTRLDPPTIPDVIGYRINNGSADTLTLRDNQFDSSGYAASTSRARIDAMWNWWGDESGPFHPFQNPNGHGGQVGSGILFDPWYTDTLFFNTSARDPFIPHPSVFSLSVYPNPFNSTAKIKLEVPNPMIVKVELFNLLGRKVKELWNAPVAYEKEVTFDGANLSSGIYFVRATDTIWNRSLMTKKMVMLK